MLYLCEGTKILFRMGYSIMKKLHEVILTVEDPTKMLETLKAKGPEVINDSSYILNWGFKMRLTRYNNSYTQQKEQTPAEGSQLGSKVVKLYKHKMDVASTLMSDADVRLSVKYRWNTCSNTFL